MLLVPHLEQKLDFLVVGSVVSSRASLVNQQAAVVAWWATLGTRWKKRELGTFSQRSVKVAVISVL